VTKVRFSPSPSSGYKAQVVTCPTTDLYYFYVDTGTAYSNHIFITCPPMSLPLQMAASFVKLH